MQKGELAKSPHTIFIWFIIFTHVTTIEKTLKSFVVLLLISVYIEVMIYVTELNFSESKCKS